MLRVRYTLCFCADRATMPITACPVQKRLRSPACPPLLSRPHLGHVHAGGGVHVALHLDARAGVAKVPKGAEEARKDAHQGEVQRGLWPTLHAARPRHAAMGVRMRN